MQKNRHLGSGLDALFKTSDDLGSFIDDIQNNSKNIENYGRKLVLRTDEIVPNPYQPRKTFDPQALEDLASSIKVHGVFNPILVRRVDNGYQLISGERRLKASVMAGKEEIPAIVMDFNDRQMMEVSLLENIQREDLNAIEEANGYRQLIDNLGYTQEQLAQQIGKSREHVSNTLRLLRLPAKVQQMVMDGRLTMGQARPLITLDDDRQIIKLANKIAKDGLSVRKVEQLAKGPEKTEKPAPIMDNATLYVQNQLQHRLQTRVRILPNAITISYQGTDDLNRILELLGYSEEV